MTPRERVLATFEGRKTDQIPVHHIGISGHASRLIMGRESYVGGQIQQFREMNALWDGGQEALKECRERSRRDSVDLAKALGHDIIRLTWWAWNVRPTKKIDDFTFLFGDPDGQWYTLSFDPFTELFHKKIGKGLTELTVQPPEPVTLEAVEKIVTKMERDLDQFHPSETPSPEIQNILAQHKDYVVRQWSLVANLGYHPFWLEASALFPDLTRRYLDVMAERGVRQVPSLAASGVKLVFGGHDLASKDGPMFSPRTVRDLMLPALKRVADAIHKHGMYYLFASDGNLWPIADILFKEAGIDGYYEIDGRAAMDLRKLRERFPSLTLLGNISSHTLHVGSRQEVVDETLSCLEAAKELGRIVVGVSNYIMPMTPPENLMAMLETIRDNL